MTRISIDHVCEDADCPHIGQRTFPGCKCHKTREQMLEAEVVRLRERLQVDAAHWKERHDTVLQKHIECCGAPAQGKPDHQWTEDELALAFFDYSACSQARCTFKRLGGCHCVHAAYKAVNMVKHVLPRSFPLTSSPPSTGLPAPAPHAEVRESELAEWKQAASVEAGLRREFLEQVEAAREFVKRHPALSLIDLAEFEVFIKIPAAIDAALPQQDRSGK